MPLDELALAMAALELGHDQVLCEDRQALARRAGETGRALWRDTDGGTVLAIDDSGVAGLDVVCEPVTLSEHRSTTLGVLLLSLHEQAGRPVAGAGPVEVATLAEQLRRRGRDGAHSLIGSLRSLHRLGLVVFDEGVEEVRVGPALAGQPPAFFAAFEAGRERVEAVDGG